MEHLNTKKGNIRIAFGLEFKNMLISNIFCRYFGEGYDNVYNFCIYGCMYPRTYRKSKGQMDSSNKNI